MFLQKLSHSKFFDLQNVKGTKVLSFDRTKNGGGIGKKH